MEPPNHSLQPPAGVRCGVQVTRACAGARRESIVRKQYYFRPSNRGLLAWDVDRLVQLSKELPRKQVLLTEIRELDEAWYGEGEAPTWRAMIEHIRLIEEAELAYPIILSTNGGVMDGMHRVAKAALQRRSHIEAVRFAQDPAPDHVGRGPTELPY
jgi:hypothetical protein